MTDAELIEAYSSRQDEDAFGELMRRHGAMVYRACHRLLKDTHEAEDASQAVFVVLARKAGGLRQGDLAAWLYRVAHLVAAETVRKRMHRAKREESYAMDEAIQTDAFAVSDVADPALLRLVDAALLSLPERYREAVILRYLQNHSEAEAAQRAGCAVGTLSMRASRGIERLRQRLSKRGVALGGVALASLLTSEASAAVPETLLPSILATVKTAVATTATATALPGVALGAKTGATTTAVMLAKGSMKAMFIAKVKMVAAVATAVVLTGTAVPVGIRFARRDMAVAAKEAPAPIPVTRLDEADGEAPHVFGSPPLAANVTAPSARTPHAALGKPQTIGGGMATPKRKVDGARYGAVAPRPQDQREDNTGIEAYIGPLFSAWVKMMDTPEIREQIMAEVTESVRSTYAPLFRYLQSRQVPDETLSQFESLLVNKEFRHSQASTLGIMSTIATNATEASADAFFQKFEAEQDAFERQIEALLDADGYAVYRGFEMTNEGRKDVEDFKRQLADGGAALSPAQEHEIILAICETQTNSASFTSDIAPGGSLDGVARDRKIAAVKMRLEKEDAKIREQLTAEQLKGYSALRQHDGGLDSAAQRDVQRMETMEKRSETACQRAADILTPEQLARFKAFQQRRLTQKWNRLTGDEKLTPETAPASPLGR